MSEKWKKIGTEEFDSNTKFTKKEKIVIHEQDPFNPQNFIDCRIDRNTYALTIDKVNGEWANQSIASTPKFHYPFDFTEEHRFHFPPEIQKIEEYSKIDGTNILLFSYKDANNKSFISYRTRMMAFLSEEFKILLDKCLIIHPDVPELLYKNHCNLAFEMAGYLNPIVFVYDQPIDLFLLYGIRPNGILVSPTSLKSGSVSRATLHTIYCVDPVQLESIYLNRQQELEKKLIDIGEGKYKGEEGVMWYCHMPEFIRAYKLKPPTIETLAWTAGGGERVIKLGIYTTLKNACEDVGNLTYELVEPYLLEEYSQDEINIHRKFIDEKIDLINFERDLEKKIIQIYKENNLDVNADKRGCMRFFASKFSSDKKHITRIYHVLEKYFIK